MPTHEEAPRFRRQFDALTPMQQRAVRRAIAKFVADLRERGTFRKGLRVKPLLGRDGVFEMTWADDGRALFTYGPSVRGSERHIVWLEIGGHEIFESR